MNQKIDIINTLSYKLIEKYNFQPVKTSEKQFMLMDTQNILEKKFSNILYIIKLIDCDSLGYQNIINDMENIKSLMSNNKVLNTHPVIVSYFIIFSNETFDFYKNNLILYHLSDIFKQKLNITVTFLNNETNELQTENCTNKIQFQILSYLTGEYERNFIQNNIIYTRNDILNLSKNTPIDLKSPVKINKISVTKIIILIDIFTFIAGFIVLQMTGQDTFHDYGDQINILIIQNNEYWRLITSIFLHVDIIHILSNMYFLFICGEIVEKFLGKIKFIIIFFIAGVAGNLLSLFLLPPNVASLGASGACMGLGGVILYFYLNKKSNFRKYFHNMGMFIFVILFNAFYGFVLPELNINNWAHLGGFITGIIMGFIYSFVYE